MIYGRECFTAYPGYTAIAALTTFPATVCSISHSDFSRSSSDRATLRFVDYWCGYPNSSPFWCVHISFRPAPPNRETDSGRFCFRTDSARMIINAPPSHAAEVDAINEARGFQVPSRAITRESVYNNPHAEKGSL